MSICRQYLSLIMIAILMLLMKFKLWYYYSFIYLQGHVELNMYVPKGPWYDFYTVSFSKSKAMVVYIQQNSVGHLLGTVTTL